MEMVTLQEERHALKPKKPGAKNTEKRIGSAYRKDIIEAQLRGELTFYSFEYKGRTNGKKTIKKNRRNT